MTRVGPVRLLVGGYTDEPGGDAPHGVVPVRHHERVLKHDGPALDVASPSYLIRHPARALAYAVCESGPARLAAISVDGALDVVAELPLPGRSPCHLRLIRDATRLVVANYGDGSVVSVRLDTDGLPVDVVGTSPPADSGGPHPRQQGAHAHHVVCGPDGMVWVTDLSADTVRRIGVAADGALHENDPAITLPAGTGPRQTRLRADGRTAYVLGELSGELLTVALDGAGGSVVDRRPSWITEPGGENLPAHLLLDRDRLYVSHRGLDRVAVFDVSRGTPTAMREIPTGRWPRHFTIHNGWLYVAEQFEDRITVRRLARPDLVLASAAVRRPSCILPLPPPEPQP